jgi:hypothetical protein
LEQQLSGDTETRLTCLSWDLTRWSRHSARSEDQPESEADDHAGYSGYRPGHVLARVFGIPGGYGSDPQNFAELE